MFVERKHKSKFKCKIYFVFFERPKTGMFEKNYLNLNNESEANVMIRIFGYFDHIFAKGRFFVKTNPMMFFFCARIVVYRVKISIFSPIFWRKYFQSHNIGPPRADLFRAGPDLEGAGRRHRAAVGVVDDGARHEAGAAVHRAVVLALLAADYSR
jgi:hypothetical protein